MSGFRSREPPGADFCETMRFGYLCWSEWYKTTKAGCEILAQWEGEKCGTLIDGDGAARRGRRWRRRRCAVRLSHARRRGTSSGRANFAQPEGITFPVLHGPHVSARGRVPCAHVAPCLYLPALRTSARPCCVLGVPVQFCRRPTTVSPDRARRHRVRPASRASPRCHARASAPCAYAVLAAAHVAPRAHARHDAVAQVCVVRARVMRVCAACACALRAGAVRAGAVCLCRGLPTNSLSSR